MSSPNRGTPDSPSRQLLRELSQLAISAQEGFYAQLDKDTEEREKLHIQALAQAAEKHDRVRQSVELERRRLEAHIEAERARRENEAKKEIDRQQRQEAQLKLEEKKREAERAKAIEAEQKQLAELEKTKTDAEAATKARDDQRKSDAAKRAQDEQDAQKRRADEAKSRAQQALNSAQASTQTQQNEPTNSLPPAQPATAGPSQGSTNSVPQAAPTLPTQSTPIAEWEAEHNRYLEIHTRLKDLRSYMLKTAQQHPQLKNTMGDMRRQLKKSVGQLTEGKGANRAPLQSILTILKSSLKTTDPSIPITPFLANPPPNPDPTSSSSPNGPALLIYLLNIFSKAIIAQWISEAGPSPKAADPIGVIASHVFAHPELRWNNGTHSLIDILLAKFHKVCPPVFGIHGPETTVQGKERLGWQREEGGGPFVSQQRHFERMSGLGAGFASLSLRNYETARTLRNPFPDYHYWQALARIANVPPGELTQTHFVLLKAMVEGYEERFVRFYGGAAVAALRFVLVELPGRVPGGGGTAAKSLGGLVEVLRKDKKLVL